MIARLVGGVAAIILSAVGAMAGPDWKPLMSADEVAAQIEARDVLILDIRAPKKTKAGPGYLDGHLPGAVNAPYGLWRGPRDNPGQLITDAALTALLQASGIEKDSAIVVTHLGRDASDFGAAARVYWTLKSAGLTTLSILDGGVNAWIGQGRDVETEVVKPTPSTIVAALSDTWNATRSDVKAIIETGDGTLIDARPTPFLRGTRKHPIAKKAGTLAGAEQVDNLKLIGNKPVLGDEKPILTRLRDSGAIPDTGPVVSFCNTGHWAATNWFVMSELEGRPNVKLYAGSMVDWTRYGGDTILKR